MRQSLNLSVFLAIVITMLIPSALAWGNGFSIYDDPIFADDTYTWSSTTMYGTHDYLTQKALELLPENERTWVNNRALFYGTELPDSSGYDESINDRPAQYAYFNEDGQAIDSSLATRSMKRYDSAIEALARGGNTTASKYAGTLISYVSDAGLFSRVIAEPLNGLRYEGYVQMMTKVVYPSDEFEDLYGGYIKYDGQLEIISPYDAIMKVARATYLGKKDGSCTAQWMDDNYNNDDPDFISCAGRNLNNAVNAMADVLHTLYQTGVNGKEYEVYAYDWENAAVQDGTPEILDDNGETDEPEEGTEGPEVGLSDGSDEPNQEPPKITINEEPLPQPKKASKGGEWVYIIALAVLAAIALLALMSVNRRKAKKLPEISKKAEFIAKKTKQANTKINTKKTKKAKKK